MLGSGFGLLSLGIWLASAFACTEWTMVWGTSNSIVSGHAFIFPWHLVQVLRILNQANILSQLNFDKIKSHLPTILEPLSFLLDKGLLNQERLNQLIHYGDFSIHQGFEIFKAARGRTSDIVTTGEMIDAVIKHREPKQLARALVILANGDCLSAENKDAVSTYYDPSVPGPSDRLDEFAEALVRLKYAQILNVEHRKALNLKSPKYGAELLCALKGTNLVSSPETQARLRNHSDIWLLLATVEALGKIKIPLSKSLFHDILDVAKESDYFPQKKRLKALNREIKEGNPNNISTPVDVMNYLNNNVNINNSSNMFIREQEETPERNSMVTKIGLFTRQNINSENPDVNHSQQSSSKVY